MNRQSLKLLNLAAKLLARQISRLLASGSSFHTFLLDFHDILTSSFIGGPGMEMISQRMEMLSHILLKLAQNIHFTLYGFNLNYSAQSVPFYF